MNLKGLHDRDWDIAFIFLNFPNNNPNNTDKKYMANMGIQDTLLCRFLFDTKRFGTIYYFLKQNDYGEGGIRTLDKSYLL